jgi:hypothetical protein
MKALDPRRSRALLYYFFSLLFWGAFFVERHMKTHLGVTLPTALAACLFLLLGLRARYNLTDEPYR